MSKGYLFIILYIAGWFFFGLWLCGDKENMKKLSDKIGSDPELACIPENLMRIAVFVAVVVFALPWPWHIIYLPLRAFYKAFIKKSKE